jgi:hypothetical protein
MPAQATRRSRTLARVLLFTVCSLPLAVPAADAVRHGTLELGTWVDAAKTPAGKEPRRHRLVYEWDTGLTHETVHTLDGKLVSERRYRAVPPGTPDEVEEAAAVVLADAEVAQILERQPSLGLQGGFAMDADGGVAACGAPARCLQMFLYDGDNVVRHMLVDLRTGTLVERDYVPPRNRGAAR